jgi:predicted MPP superfamily phosphohydrolase
MRKPSSARGPLLTRIEMELPRWPRALDGFRIAQISDVHIGPILDRRFAATVTERLNALAPDLIAVTGDLVDGDVRHLAAEVAPFAALRAPHGIYFVTGNHDYYSGADAWVAGVRRLGMTPLRNARVAIERDGAVFDLAGVEDHHAHFVHPTYRSDVAAALAGRDPARPVVLLAHDPLTFKAAARLGVDLQLSGHTHGGQIWPFKYMVRLSTPFVAGRYRLGDAQLFVSRGTGFWGPAMRLFAPAEIVEITLRAASR